MEQYHKIQTVFARDPATNHKTLILGQYSKPEFAYLAGNSWSWTEKVDGTNIRIRLFEGKLEFRGKSNSATLMPSLIERLHQHFDVDKLRAVFPDPDTRICLYGEGYGLKIQNGGDYIPDGQDFILFDVRVGEWWLNREDVDDVAAKLGIKIVPIVGRGTLDQAVQFARSGYASQVSARRQQAEGLVIRPDVELVGRNGERVITKIKLRDFGNLPVT